MKISNETIINVADAIRRAPPGMNEVHDSIKRAECAVYALLKSPEIRNIEKVRDEWCDEYTEMRDNYESALAEIYEIVRVARNNPDGLNDFLEMNFPKERQQAVGQVYNKPPESLQSEGSVAQSGRAHSARLSSAGRSCAEPLVGEAAGSIPVASQSYTDEGALRRIIRKAVEEVPTYYSGFPKAAAVVVDTWAMVFASYITDQLLPHLRNTPVEKPSGVDSAAILKDIKDTMDAPTFIDAAANCRNLTKLIMRIEKNLRGAE